MPRSINGLKPKQIYIEGSPFWVEWTRQLAAASGLTASDVIDAALAAYAEGRGFRPPPARTIHQLLTRPRD